MLQKCLKNTGQAYTGNATFENAESITLSESTLSEEGFPVRIFPTPDSGQDLTESEADCSLKPFAWFANYNRELLCWRTWQRCFLEGWTEFSGRWPRSGTMRNGIVFQHMYSVPPTAEIGCSLLPTPNAMACISMWASAEYKIQEPMRMDCHTYGKRDSGAKLGSNLSWSIAEWHLRNGHQRDEALIPDPCFYEMVMGFPLGWTDLKD